MIAVWLQMYRYRFTGSPSCTSSPKLMLTESLHNGYSTLRHTGCQYAAHCVTLVVNMQCLKGHNMLQSTLIGCINMKVFFSISFQYLANCSLSLSASVPLSLSLSLSLSLPPSPPSLSPFFSQSRPDTTREVDWSLKTNYLLTLSRSLLSLESKCITLKQGPLRFMQTLYQSIDAKLV